MKKLFQTIGLISIIAFSFFYTDKVLKVIREEDKIMIELKEIKETLNKKPINATIIEDTIIPGINGKKINIDKSYKEMKKTGIFNKEQIIYDTITPDISITKNKDKYIKKGNSKKQIVSIIFILNNNKYIDKLEKELENKQIVINYFITYQYLISNSTKIKEMNNKEIYNYGQSGTYTPDNIIFSNNLINRISNNAANLCLTINKNNKTKEICSKNNLYTIIPTIIAKEKPYNTVKNELSNGSIILLDINKQTINEINLIINYIEKKGLKIEGLSKLINEQEEI